MWVIFAPAILLSMLSEASRRREAVERLASLGLPSAPDQLDAAFLNAFVPVRLWPDGDGLWRAVTEDAIAIACRDLGTNPSTLCGDNHDLARMRWELIPAKVWEDRVSPQYVNEAGHLEPYGVRALYVYTPRGGKITRSLFLNEMTWRVEVLTVSPTARGPSRAFWRMREFAQSAYPTIDLDYSDLDARDWVVGDAVIERVRSVLEQLSDRDSDPQVARDADIRIELMLYAWADRAEILSSRLQSLAAKYGELDELSSLSLDEFAARLAARGGGAGQSGHPDVGKVLRHELGVLSQEANRLLLSAKDAARDEADSAEKLVPSLEIVVRDSRGEEGILFNLYCVGCPRGERPVETVTLLLDEQTGRSSWTTGSGRHHKVYLGILASMVELGLLRTPSEVSELVGTPEWVFPGPLQGNWEVHQLVGTYAISGGEDLVPLLRIAGEHGLLSEQTLESWRSVVEEVGDGFELLRQQGRVR